VIDGQNVAFICLFMPPNNNSNLIVRGQGYPLGKGNDRLSLLETEPTKYAKYCGAQ
jgi:hypothetical protein